MIPTQNEFYQNAYYLAYYPVQSFLIWKLEKGETPDEDEGYQEKDFKGWKNRNVYFDIDDGRCVYAVSVIGTEGHLTLLSMDDIPDTEPKIMPAQPGTYAVVAHEIWGIDCHFLGCITRFQRYFSRYPVQEMHECFLLSSYYEPVQVRVCCDCGRYFSDGEPEFCIACGSLNNKYLTVPTSILPRPRYYFNSIMNDEDYLTDEQLKELSE